MYKLSSILASDYVLQVPFGVAVDEAANIYLVDACDSTSIIVMR